MASEFVRTRRVEFAETDAAGLLHFAHYLRYMEETEHAFLRSLGLSVHPRGEDPDGSRIGFPRLACRCEYRRPLRFEDVVRVELRVARKGTSSIVYQFVLEHEEETAAIGEIAVVGCRFRPGGAPERVPLPEEWAARIEASSAEPLRFRSAGAAPDGAADPGPAGQ